MTLDELKLATARELRILADGDSLSAEDDGKLQQKYESLHAMLDEDDLAPWGVDDDVPDKVAQPVIWMLAALSVNVFAIGDPRRQELILLGTLHNNPISLAERQLRKVLAPEHVGDPVGAESF